MPGIINQLGEPPSIWLIGNSMLMDGIEACLRKWKMDNLVHWNNTYACLTINLDNASPDLIIYECGIPGTSALLHLLTDCPGLHLLGIDLTSNQVLVMNSYQLQSPSMNDLSQIIQGLAGAAR